MPGGKRFKFHGSQIQVMTGFSADSPSIAISGITNANPAVVHAPAHGLTDGAVFMIEGVAGMEEVNDELFVGLVQDADHIALADVNSSGYGVYESGGNIDEAEFSNMCELTNYNRQGGSSPESPATSLCSTAQEFELGLPDFGTTEINFNFAPRTAIQVALESFYRSTEKMAVKVILPNNGGEMVQLGHVQQKSENGGVGQAVWIGSATIRNTGPRVDIEA